MGASNPLDGPFFVVYGGGRRIWRIMANLFLMKIALAHNIVKRSGIFSGAI